MIYISIIICMIILFLIITYNKLIKLQNLNKEGWSGIDVQLKQRSSLIPNLIESVKGYMGYEKNVLEKITKLRSQAESASTPHERADNENQLTKALRQLFALSENYPDLKANQNFLELQKSLETIEDQIQLSRRYYNGTVRDFNTLIQSFPTNLVAKQFNFQPSEFFEANDPKERELPTVKF